MSAPSWWGRERFRGQVEYVNTILAAAIQTSAVQITQPGVDAARVWANYPAADLHRYAAEQSRGCAMRMQAMSKTAQWYELQKRVFFWRFLAVTCVCWKMGRNDLVPSVRGLHDALPLVSGFDFVAWLRDEGERMISGLGLRPKEHGG